MNFFQRFTNYLNPGTMPGRIQAHEAPERMRGIILQFNLNILLGIGTISVILGLALFANRIDRPSVYIYPAFLLLIAILALGRKIPTNLRAVVFLLILLVIGTYMIVVNGLTEAGLVLLLTFAVLSGNLLNPKAGVPFLLGTTIYIAILGLFFYKFEPVATNLPNTLLVSVPIFLYCGVAIGMSISTLARGLASVLGQQAALNAKLEEESQLLEKHIRMRTEELSIRITRMDAARRIGNEISAESTMDDLLNKAVNIIREEFNFYHAGLFLNDEKNEFAILRAATGEAGAAMLQRGHRLKIGEIGIVGYVTSKGESRITADVTQDPNHFKNPLLPDTASEIAVPLRIGERIIGALDVQSTQRNPFSPVDVEVLQIISDQLATAVNKARLLESFQQNLQELEGTYRQSTQQSWQNFLRNARKSYGFQYRESEIAPHAALTPEAEQALRQANLVATPLEQGVTAIAVPISLRGQPIGVVNLRFASARLSPEMIELVRDATDRLAVSLENARLLEEIQFRAQRERLVGDVSSKVRAATDVESILRIAANELGQSLGVAEVVVQLHSPD